MTRCSLLLLCLHALNSSSYDLQESGLWLRCTPYLSFQSLLLFLCFLGCSFGLFLQSGSLLFCLLLDPVRENAHSLVEHLYTWAVTRQNGNMN